MSNASADFPLDIRSAHVLLVHYLEHGNENKAMEILNHIIHCWPEQTGKYCGFIASLLARQGQLELAITLYQKAIEFDQNDRAARLYLGIALHSQKKVAEAKAQFDYLEQHHLGSAEAYFQKALMSLNEHKPEEADKALQSVIALLAKDRP